MFYMSSEISVLKVLSELSETSSLIHEGTTGMRSRLTDSIKNKEVLMHLFTLGNFDTTTIN